MNFLQKIMDKLFPYEDSELTEVQKTKEKDLENREKLFRERISNFCKNQVKGEK